MKSIITFLSLAVSLSSAQFFYHQHASSSFPLAFHTQQPQAQPPQNQYSHPSVVDNSLRESQLPPELRKSDRFYKNPHVAAALAKESWFTDQESPVIDREAEKIPRDMVFKLFKNAGWIKRR